MRLRGPLALLLAAAACPAHAQVEPEPSKVPAAWVEARGAERAALVDLRGFYHHVGGAGARRSDWFGTELLGYFDLLDGLSGAFVVRHEVRDEVADYATVMLLPRVTKTSYLVTSVGVGNGALFVPTTRLDLQLRAFVDRKREVMLDVGGIVTRWPSDAIQLAHSVAAIFWREPWIVELRQTLLITEPGFGSLRPTMRGDVVVLYGKQRVRWLVARVTVGDEPENVPGVAFADTRDIAVGALALSYRHWLTPSYGLFGEVEGFVQLDTWQRVGATLAIFAHF